MIKKNIEVYDTGIGRSHVIMRYLGEILCAFDMPNSMSFLDDGTSSVNFISNNETESNLSLVFTTVRNDFDKQKISLINFDINKFEPTNWQAMNNIPKMMLAKAGVKFKEWIPIVTEEVNGMTCIHYSYKIDMPLTPFGLVETHTYIFYNYRLKHELCFSFFDGQAEKEKYKMNQILSSLYIEEFGKTNINSSGWIDKHAEQGIALRNYGSIVCNQFGCLSKALPTALSLIALFVAGTNVNYIAGIGAGIILFFVLRKIMLVFNNELVRVSKEEPSRKTKNFQFTMILLYFAGILFLLFLLFSWLFM